ncbi:hypothetical protein DPMN_093274 [Dreissena polymorpha]|uniref:Uncharacterized protein n=1 Tax=Dreissena polymorpha TaxID=45954 RepID=A0A9D4R0R1_DREPO|nr:hypothetical protein DPMN_093274 [Dreissena polymorpha]
MPCIFLHSSMRYSSVRLNSVFGECGGEVPCSSYQSCTMGSQREHTDRLQRSSA